MAVTVSYKNDAGCVVMNGNSRGNVRIIAVEGLGWVQRAYEAAVYSGYDGQETLSSRALPRNITIAVEICGNNLSKTMQSTLDVLGRPGYLFVNDGYVNRRIFCDQVTIADAERVLPGQLSRFVVQFVCDNPYFEDYEENCVSLYRRVKLLESPFSMPCKFGEIIMGADVKVSGVMDVEPVISFFCPEASEAEGFICVNNETTGVGIKLNYTPGKNDTIIIDVKKRKITSSVRGNLIQYLAEDSFLGDFILKKGVNVLSVEIGNMTSGFSAECRYSNLFFEAVMV